MKKNFLLLFIFLIFISCIVVNAAPVTYERTREDLKLPADVNVQDINIKNVLNTPSVDSKAKVYDFANLLTEAEEAKLYIQVNEFIHNTGMDAVIITLDKLEGHEELKYYAYDFYDYNDFMDVGITFIIYTENPEKPVIYMCVNGATDSDAREAYTDARISEVLKDDYIGACETFIKLADGFYIKTFGYYKNLEPDTVMGNHFPWIEITIISVVLTFIVTVLVITKYQKPEKRSDLTIKKSINQTSMIVKCEYDRPLVEKAENS